VVISIKTLRRPLSRVVVVLILRPSNSVPPLRVSVVVDVAVVVFFSNSAYLSLHGLREICEGQGACAGGYLLREHTMYCPQCDVQPPNFQVDRPEAIHLSRLHFPFVLFAVPKYVLVLFASKVPPHDPMSIVSLPSARPMYLSSWALTASAALVRFHWRRRVDLALAVRSHLLAAGRSHAPGLR